MMNHLLTLLLAASCIAAVGQVPDYVPTDGLVGWWPMDGNATDESGNGHDGDSSGPVPVEDRYGNDSGALEFDDGDFISLPTLTEQIPALSVAFWLKLDDYASGESPVGYNHFFNKWTDGSDDIAFVMSANTTGLYLYSGSTPYQSDVLPSLGEWQHVAFVIAPPYAAIYLDGTVVQTFENVNAMGQVPEQFMQIGGNGNIPGYNSVDGSMDEVGLWNRALTAEEVEAIYQSEPVSQVPDYVPTDGLVAYFPFDGNVLNLVSDDDGLPTEVGFDTDRFGQPSGALAVVGGQTEVLLPLDSYAEGGDPRSMSYWLKRADNATDGEPFTGVVYNGQSCGQKSFGCGANYAAKGVSVDFSCGVVTFEHAASHQECGWNHIVVVVPDIPNPQLQDVAVYENGELLPFLTGFHLDAAIATVHGTYTIGGSFFGWGDRLYDEADLTCGVPLIDDLAFFNRALSSDEVNQLYIGATVSGCTDETACNFNAEADVDDGTCYACDIPASHCGIGTVWDASSQTCIVANPSDSNFDGCVQLTDLLDLLSAYGTCGDCGGDCSLANATSTCVDGECVIESCNDGFADYNGEALDGCESEEVPSWSCGEDLVFEGHTYATVQINGQCWFAENLRSTSYANGDAIAGNLNDAAWSTTSSGGRATFGEGASVCYGPAPGGDACNEAFSLASYGRLYNWHAVNDARGLCPSGWHVPSDGEWTTLTDGIGGALTAGNTLKAGSGWFNNSNGASPNGFDAFPGGQRMNAGNFQGAGTDAFFWTSTELSSVQVWFRSMGWNLPEVVRNPAEKNVGMSVRCLKD